jgi:DNA-binding LacI/PurR family transcriptional regulator
MEGVHEGISEFSYTTLTHTLYDSDKKEIQQIIDEVDGLIILSAGPKSTDFKSFQKVPWVKAMGALDNPPDANHVTYDNDEIGVMAAEYLMRNKCEKFYYFGGKGKLFAPRYDNFCKTLEKNNYKGEIIELDYAQLTLDVLAPLAKARFEEIFYGNRQRIGFFLSSTSYLTLTYQLLYSLGIIPMTDVEIITCENMRSVIDGIIPRPTVIDLRMKEIGKRSVEMLMRLLQTPHENNVYEKITLAPKLIESTYNRHHKKS